MAEIVAAALLGLVGLIAVLAGIFALTIDPRVKSPLWAAVPFALAIACAALGIAITYGGSP